MTCKYYAEFEYDDRVTYFAVFIDRTYFWYSSDEVCQSSGYKLNSESYSIAQQTEIPDTLFLLTQGDVFDEISKAYQAAQEARST